MRHRVCGRRTCRRTLAAVLWITAVLALGGCGSKEKYELRETALLQIEAGDYDGAITSLDAALAHSDGTVGEFELDVLKYRAEAEYRSGDYAAAADTYDVLRQVDGEKQEYISRLCGMYILTEETDEALEYYQKLYELDADGQDTLSALVALGALLEKQGREDEALALFQTALDDGIRSGVILNQLALRAMEEERYDDALAYIEDGLTLGGEGREALLYNQAVIYEQRLDFEKALEILETYVREFGSADEVDTELAFLRSRTAPAP